MPMFLFALLQGVDMMMAAILFPTILLATSDPKYAFWASVITFITFICNSVWTKHLDRKREERIKENTREVVSSAKEEFKQEAVQAKEEVKRDIAENTNLSKDAFSEANGFNKKLKAIYAVLAEAELPQSVRDKLKTIELEKNNVVEQRYQHTERQ